MKPNNEKKDAGKAAVSQPCSAIGITLPIHLRDWIFRIPINELNWCPELRAGISNIAYVNQSASINATPYIPITTTYSDYVFKGPGTYPTETFNTLGYVKYDVPSDSPIHELEEFTIALWVNSRIFGPYPIEAGLAPFIYINGGEPEPVQDHHGSYNLGLQDTASTTQLRISGYFWDAADVEWHGHQQDVNNPALEPDSWFLLVQRYAADTSTLDMFAIPAGANPISCPEPINSQIQYAGPMDPDTGEQPLLGPLIFDNITAIYLAAWEDWVVKGNNAASWQKNSYGGLMKDIIFWGRALSNCDIRDLLYCLSVK
jgi:hypothetical protein